MLYPKEDPDTHRLQFACRTCQYSEEAVSSCVFRNILNNAVGETAGVTQDVGSDPTVGVPDFCTLCGCAISCSICGVELVASEIVHEYLVDEEYMESDQNIADDEEMVMDDTYLAEGGAGVLEADH
jgi:DNA-directed RNA polymerase subunit M/transcription elongation factor TFIIS